MKVETVTDELNEYFKSDWELDTKKAETITLKQARLWIEVEPGTVPSHLLTLTYFSLTLEYCNDRSIRHKLSCRRPLANN